MDNLDFFGDAINSEEENTSLAQTELFSYICSLLDTIENIENTLFISENARLMNALFEKYPTLKFHSTKSLSEEYLLKEELKNNYTLRRFPYGTPTEWKIDNVLVDYYEEFDIKRLEDIAKGIGDGNLYLIVDKNFTKVESFPNIEGMKKEKSTSIVTENQKIVASDFVAEALSVNKMFFDDLIAPIKKYLSGKKMFLLGKIVCVQYKRNNKKVIKNSQKEKTRSTKYE